MFIEFDGIDGESDHADHAGWSDAYAFGFGAANDRSGSTRTTGAPLLDEFVVSKPIDRASPLLFHHLLTGAVIPEATFEAHRFDPAAGTTHPYLTYTFTDVRITSLTTGTTAETLTFQYGSVEEEYVPITASGAPGSPITRTLDRALLGASIARTPGTESEVQGGSAFVFVRPDGIPGESLDLTHQDWIDGRALGLCVAAPAGKTPSVGDITVVKRIDAASPLLLDHAATGTVIPTVDIEIFVPLGGVTAPHLVYDLDEVVITSVRTQTDPETGFVLETVTLSFAMIEQTYTEFDAAGTSQGTTTVTYDVETNTAG